MGVAAWRRTDSNPYKWAWLKTAMTHYSASSLSIKLIYFTPDPIQVRPQIQNTEGLETENRTQTIHFSHYIWYHSNVTLHLRSLAKL